MSLRNLDSLSTLGFQHVGDFHLEEGKVRFTLNSHKDSRGAYAFVVSENVRYIGVTESTMYQRMNGYRNPGPTQETNKRINPMIIQAQHVQIHFLPDSEISEFVTIIRRSDSQHQIPTDMRTLERFLISLFRPEWNQT
jgi:hypothetical protein